MQHPPKAVNLGETLNTIILLYYYTITTLLYQYTNLYYIYTIYKGDDVRPTVRKPQDILIFGIGILAWNS